MLMGEAMGDWTLINHNGAMIGGMMDAIEEGKAPYGDLALQVADMEDAKRSVEAGGGTVRIGPTELPLDTGWLIQTTESQGAGIMFCGPREPRHSARQSG